MPGQGAANPLYGQREPLSRFSWIEEAPSAERLEQARQIGRENYGRGLHLLRLHSERTPQLDALDTGVREGLADMLLASRAAEKRIPWSYLLGLSKEERFTAEERAQLHDHVVGHLADPVRLPGLISSFAADPAQAPHELTERAEDLAAAAFSEAEFVMTADHGLAGGEELLKQLFAERYDALPGPRPLSERLDQEAWMAAVSKAWHSDRAAERRYKHALVDELQMQLAGS